MAIYIVMETTGKAEADGTRTALFIRDGFSFLAFLLPAFWLLWHRLWIEAALALAAMLCLGAFGTALGLGGTASAALSLLISLYVGLEGAALRIAALRRRGWIECGVVQADSRADAEDRHLLETAPEEQAGFHPPPRPLPRIPPSQKPVTGPAMGLFDYPGNR